MKHIYHMKLPRYYRNVGQRTLAEDMTVTLGRSYLHSIVSEGTGCNQ
jgi:hypothetical protein